MARKAACEQQLEEARAALTAAFANWRAELTELELDDHAAAAALELARAGQPAAPALAAVVERARRTAADERSALATARLRSRGSRRRDRDRDRTPRRRAATTDPGRRFGRARTAPTGMALRCGG